MSQLKKKQSDSPILSKKEHLAQKRHAAKTLQEFINFTSKTFFTSVLIGLFLFPFGGIRSLGGAIAIILAIALSYKYPRQAIWAFLIYMPFSGTVTYAAGGNTLFQLAKDVFYIPPLIAVYQDCQRKKVPFIVNKSLKSSLSVLLVCCLLTLIIVNGSQQWAVYENQQLIENGIQQLNVKPPEYPLSMGMLGLKVLMGYIPLISCAYYLIRNKDDLLFMTRLSVVVALICFILCFIQYIFLLTGRCEGTRYAEGAELFKASLQSRCLVGGALLYSPSQGVIRLPGTFVAPWQWGWFMISSAYFIFACAFSDPVAFWRIIGLTAMAADFVVAVISGQRIALALVPISFLVLLILTGQIANLKRFIPLGLGLGFILTVAAAMYPQIVQERLDSFLNRWEASPADEFILNQFEFTLRNLHGSMIGLGLGRATNSARNFGNTALIETWFPKVMHEIGPMGLLAFLGVVTTLTILTFKAYRSVSNPSLRGYAASFWVFVLFISYQTYYYPLDVDPVAVYYWFFAGVILKLPEIEKQETQKLTLIDFNSPKINKRKSSRKRTLTRLKNQSK